MTQENGDRPESLGLWPDDEQPVPLLTAEHASTQPMEEGETARPAVLTRTSANGRATERRTAADFSPERMLRAPAGGRPSSGWRLAAFRLSGGLVRVAPSAAELRQRELIARVKTPIRGCRKIAFISRKGGVGKTSTCLLAGHTFAAYRGDRVVA